MKLREDAKDDKLRQDNDIGTAKPNNPKEEFLSNILARLDDLFITENLSDKDMINYAFTLRDKLSEN